jgi:isopentenyl phosphate kinase
MLILKLGGAAITDKRTANTANTAAIDQIAALIARYPQKLILIHGAGSFGHIIAKDYNLHLGYQGDHQREGLIKLQLALHELNTMVIKALWAQGIPAMTVHPASMCVQENGRLVDFFLEPIQQMLAMQLIPVMYGDCVWDRGQKFSIISGDQLAVYLANQLGADKIAFGTNVDGVLDAAGQVIPRLDARSQISSQQSGVADVTGGMLGKVQEIAAVKTAQTRIFNIQKIDQLERILAGKDDVGTLIISG